MAVLLMILEIQFMAKKTVSGWTGQNSLFSINYNYYVKFVLLDNTLQLLKSNNLWLRRMIKKEKKWSKS